MALEHLWATWRSAYVTGITDGRDESGVAPDAGADVDGRTLFERILASGLPDEETFVLWRGPTCFAILNAFPYGTGHTLILPYREVGDLESLDADSLPELPTSPVDSVSYDLENKPTVLRTTDGETIAWPRYAKPESGTSFRFVIDRGAAAGAAEHAALMSFLETSEGAAFQFTPHGEVDSRPYVADLRSLRETSRGKKVVEITMQAFELRFVGP